MRILIVRTFQSGGQTLNAGVFCEPADEIASDWIMSGYAKAVEPVQEDAHVTSNPALDGMIDVPPAKPRRKAAG
jgi:hypothetical protein